MFKEMNPDDVWRELEGHKNIVGEEMKGLTEYFSKLQCIRCGGSCRMALNSAALFEKNGILPNYLAECNDCGTLFSPYTRIEVKGPTQDPLTDG